VSWRHDQFPLAPMDPRAVRQAVGRGTYLKDGGVRLLNPAPRPYYFTLYAGRHLEGRIFHALRLAPGCRTAATTQPAAVVSYEIKLPRFWQRTFTLTVSVQGDLTRIPDLVVVGKSGRALPVSIDNGVVLADLIGEEIPPGGKVARGFTLSGQQRP